ncbi:uncharacterized protein [Typha angustifolia]|uniref:uncharacterized protein n=1 Tax=Typha angustifolia TaxID=59011 RepID=UPI003C2BF109
MVLGSMEGGLESSGRGISPSKYPQPSPASWSNFGLELLQILVSQSLLVLLRIWFGWFCSISLYVECRGLTGTHLMHMVQLARSFEQGRNLKLPERTHSLQLVRTIYLLWAIW